ncbi:MULTISPECIES: MlaD family protein [Nocardia]|uniref:MlaD family protein n=1 Tax=Nocardia TaxID=1817 RepID=UPI0007E943F3|nr:MULTISPECIES: MlaD family protein [Nocardia]OBA53497.1 mammalian cell entry protein [Nocardia sp. 852002-51101_SCH5132738]OBB47999.1 mammalian cell entry protein [Nocardia sp. 852002-51244_SCH5132740]OBF66765.1 mammalian cell entry protein [Mycobacterium sp. 852002-51759_SCH5129042]
MTINRKYLIGAGSVVALALVGGVGFTVVDPDGAKSVSGFCAQMPDAVGLYPGNPVTQMGFQVGRVDKIEPEGDHVHVTFSLDGGRRFPADVRVVTRSKSILADRSVELVGNYHSGPELAAGQCIPQQHSFTPKSISEIAGSAADFIDALSPDDNKESFEKAVSGFEQALRGQGDNARALMLHASAAAASPDQLTADLGAIIENMAPLTDEALQRWPAIRSILDQMPGVVAAGIDLWPGVVDVCVGVGWLVNVLHEIQVNYGGDIWPLLQGPVADAIHLAASRSKDIAGLLNSIPAVAALLRQQAAGDGGMSIDYRPPTVQVDSPAAPALCEAANRAAPGSCSATEGQVQFSIAGLLDMVLAKGQR